jgi:hypothetical protein
MDTKDFLKGKWNDILRVKSLGKDELINEVKKWNVS